MLDKHTLNSDNFETTNITLGGLVWGGAPSRQLHCWTLITIYFRLLSVITFPILNITTPTFHRLFYVASSSFWCRYLFVLLRILRVDPTFCQLFHRSVFACFSPYWIRPASSVSSRSIFRREISARCAISPYIFSKDCSACFFRSPMWTLIISYI